MMKKNSTYFSLLVFVSILVALLNSCKKEAAENYATSVSAVNEESSVLLEMVAGANKLTLKPGVTDGQDTYVSKIDNDPNDGNGNLNYLHELISSKFYYFGQLATQRSYIKFDSLNKVPATSKITSAILYLYGESSSLSFPAGNSYFPGSSNPENACLIQRVVGGNWNQSNITWNNKPAITEKNQDTIPPSTSQWNYNTSVDVTKLVQTMVQTGNNYGFCIRLVDETAYRILEFSTSEATNPALRPKLVIKYK
ncbi:DNRLRE domain-containing protein [Panacibacter sp. KCS-6]|uniref:DNRLRE domain-containing protein n=1 Tax=Limnovirga soli TaxID=2656915 RepID=A0A8J8FCT8_9BACT|nr:DNRLRE domain-containing protein [Limnovirga soli]